MVTQEWSAAMSDVMGAIARRLFQVSCCSIKALYRLCFSRYHIFSACFSHIRKLGFLVGHIFSFLLSLPTASLQTSRHTANHCVSSTWYCCTAWPAHHQRPHKGWTSEWFGMILPWGWGCAAPWVGVAPLCCSCTMMLVAGRIEIKGVLGRKWFAVCRFRWAKRVSILMRHGV